MNTQTNTQDIVNNLIKTFGGFGMWNEDETHFDGWKWHVGTSLSFKYTRTNAFYVHTSDKGQLYITRFAKQDVTAPIFGLNDAIDFINQFDQFPDWNPEV